ncbi:RdgB/HAM1 family non-canonical purine NTP pyrophosphatase [Microbacterium suaedae]|uniref:RdgB/HAM1 family non-canonical purine NTP pyrophosphatase n=1 Tax=Microbacterium suaedae TaxID=2067813 RepID=UPI000DA211E1|nr:RdgB/HAM1 family non-canonical purine NTP pyrophosphatase [Microbacterium suaedae]
MTRIVLATHNAHKVAELQGIVSRVRPDIEVIGYDGPEPVEDGTTFAENALVKARAATAHTGLVALADDSGVCVDVLGGSPGVFSAYWAGHAKDDAANLALLLDQLSDLTRPEDRAAHYTSVIALVTPDGAEHTVEGVWPGRLATAPRGEGGFGYDPIFVPEGSDRTAAEFMAAEKNAVSHRSRALEALVPLLETL